MRRKKSVFHTKWRNRCLKTVLSLLLTLALLNEMILFNVFAASEPSENSCPGADTNNDGSFDINDVTLILNILTENNSDHRYDYNGDEWFNISDVTEILNALAGTFDGTHHYLNGSCNYCKITENLIRPTISIQSVTVNKGISEVAVTVSVKNNPGMMNLLLSVEVDDDVFTLKNATKGSGYPGLTFTKPGTAQTSSPYNFLMDAIELTANDKKDGVLFTMVFTVIDSTAVGEYDITLSYLDGDIVDENFEAIDAVTENGKITIR